MILGKISSYISFEDEEYRHNYVVLSSTFFGINGKIRLKTFCDALFIDESVIFYFASTI